MEPTTKNVVSGQTVADTENAVSYATRIALSSENRRSCGIAIANITNHNLINPKTYIYSGRILSRPAQISPGHTGLICAEKTYGSTWGAVGLITYVIEGTDKRLQIFYDVPMQRLLFEVRANVMVGFKTASEYLYEDMVYNYHGKVTLARCTMHSQKNVDGYDIDFVMEDSEKSPLTVFLQHTSP